MTDDERLLLKLRNARLRNDREIQTATFQRYRASLETINRLRSIGLWPKHLDNPTNIEMIVQAAWKLDVTPADFPLLRTVFPHVKDTGNYEVHNAERGEVAVLLDLGIPHSYVFVRYIRPLPADARCQIVTTPYVSHEVICKVSP